MLNTQTSSASGAAVRQWLPIGISLAALLLSLFNSGVSFGQSKLEEVFLPLHLEVSRGEPSMSYQISTPDGTVLQEVPGYETKFSCRTGACQEFAQIYYDGAELDLQFVDLDVLESGDYVIQSKGQLPSSSFIPGEPVYDYCFIRTVSASKQTELWLVYYEIDPLENTVKGPFKASSTILLLLQNQADSPKTDMLKHYQSLCEMADALPGK